MTKTDKILCVTVLSLFFLASYTDFVAGNATPDKEISFYSAHAWLSGKQLYRDIFTVQPPLIYYLYAVPVYLSLHLGILEDYQYLTLLGLLAIGCVIYLAFTLIRFHPEFAGNKSKQVEFCLLLLWVFVIF